MESKLFSYKAEGIVLEALNDQIKVSPVFDRKELVEKIKEALKADGFKPDEHSLQFKIEEGQLFVQGIAVKQQESRSIGFMNQSVNAG
ncbi:hypothetical protein [Mucilaginibacter lappiensis]|uniref:Uncharacterized protein n=1 Tax=Mucilaginibacter lappiensis TaxID=354630 RepID=A0A1N7CWS9_9SPHI|nr:hypothetical protein [Mucilaginibacter lappiensis]MBB6111051.1 hypothetical protein [Mucilaginibacter lappiensis]MBB6128824.1 hypothetical protein [Mucilaginibacter lappiensis]SIR68096.1 hypothetical protein SAMN05421821_11070 [Mucilaginibacter lappiensis]